MCLLTILHQCTEAVQYKHSLLVILTENKKFNVRFDSWQDRTPPIKNPGYANAPTTICLTRAVRDRIWPTSVKKNLIRIRIGTPDPDSWSEWLPKFNGDFLVPSYISGKIFVKIQSFIQRYEPFVECPSRNVEESLKNSWIRIRNRTISKFN